MNGFDRVFNNAPPKPGSTQDPARGPVTGRIVRVDDSGVWVAPIDGDQRYPLGPCRGPSDIDVGTIVMVISTQERPWVFGAELLTTLNAEARDLLILEAAAADAQALLDAHAADTTNVHGIADTSDLETQSGAQAKADQAEANANDYTDSQVDSVGGGLGQHANDTTNVHGIADTAQLETQDGAAEKALQSQREVLTVTVPGILTVGVGALRLPVDSGTWSISSVRVTAGTAPTGSSVIVDVHKNGATIYGTQANRPAIADGANAASAGTASAGTVTAGDYLTVDVDQVGSTTPGADLVVAIRLIRTA